MSRGPGRLQRQIMERLQKAPEGRLSRRELEAVLVDGEGYFSTNVLRAIKGLHRMGYLSIIEGRSLDDTLVSLPRLVKPANEKLIFELLKEAKG